MGQGHFEQGHVPPERSGRAGFANERGDGPDPAVDNGAVAVRHSVINVARGEHGPRSRGVATLVEPALDPGLELAEPRAEDRFHSKSFLGRWCWRSGYFTKHQKPSGISSFFIPSGCSRAGTSLG